jgi:hypothetical protein
MMKKTPTQLPVALTDLEMAMLFWSGAGVKGAVAHEGTACALKSRPVTSRVGRATGNPRNIQTTRLFCTNTNDDGVFLYNPKPPTKPGQVTFRLDFFNRD